MEAKIGITVSFKYNGMEYDRDIEDITIYKNYSWIGDLGFGEGVMFCIHGDLDENGKPIMKNLCIQVDGTGGNKAFEYIKENISFNNKGKEDEQ